MNAVKLAVRANFGRGAGIVQIGPYWYSKKIAYRGHTIRKNMAGSFDAFVDGVCIRQTFGVGGAEKAIDNYNKEQTQ